MKKIIKIAVINIFLLISVLLLTEFISYKIQVKKDYSGWAIHTKFFDAYKFMPVKNFINTYKKMKENPSQDSWFRPDEIKETLKREIVLLGCSFTFGVGLEENETFSKKLSDYTNRSVFNRGIPGCGINHMLYMVKEGLSSKIKNPEQFIYTFIDAHIYRLYMPASYFHNILIYYKEKNGHLVEKNDFDIWYWHSYTLRTIYEGLMYAERIYSQEQEIEFMLLHLLEINKEIKENFPNSKFTVFAYNGKEKIKIIEKDLRENGIEIIYLSDLIDKDFEKKPYVLEDDHPSALAWDTIIPELVKKLSL